MIYDNTINSYDPWIVKSFKEGKIEDVLTKYLYSFRENTNKPRFHFLIGLCMLQMGHYEEAHIAFERAQEKEETTSRKADVFDAYTMMLAQKDDEAIEKLASIPLEYLSASETVAVMSIKSSLKLPMAEELAQVLNSPYQTEADRKVMSLFAFKYSGSEGAASSMSISLEPFMFKDFNSFLYAIEEIYKLHMQQEADILLEKAIPTAMRSGIVDILKCVETIYATSFYLRMSKESRKQLWNNVEKYPNHNKDNMPEWEAAQAKLYYMEYEYRELYNGNLNILVSEMESKEHLLKNEQILLCLATYYIGQYTPDRQETIHRCLTSLISMNQKNIRYRKLYCDFLRMSGMLSHSDEVAKATIVMRKKQESAEFALLHSFHSFYVSRPCMLKTMPVHQKENGKDCPICFGTGFQPIIRSIGSGHSPSEIFTDNMESHIIEPNEAMLRDIVNWQPMNIPSPIVAKYLHSLGAYMSPRKYPDVLIPGQTYIYLNLKPEAEQRLREAGYSLMQIDPIAAARDEKGSSEEGRPFSIPPVTYEDFQVEIIHAISSQADLDAPDPEMPLDTENK